MRNWAFSACGILGKQVDSVNLASWLPWKDAISARYRSGDCPVDSSGAFVFSNLVRPFCSEAAEPAVAFFVLRCCSHAVFVTFSLNFVMRFNSPTQFSWLPAVRVLSIHNLCFTMRKNTETDSELLREMCYILDCSNSKIKESNQNATFDLNQTNNV